MLSSEPKESFWIIAPLKSYPSHVPLSDLAHLYESQDCPVAPINKKKYLKSVTKAIWA